jgi:hypothetical protein
MTAQPMALEVDPDVWHANVAELIEKKCRAREQFTTDDLHVVGEPHHPNAWGAAIQRAKKAGLIIPVETRCTGRKSGHGRLVRTWAPNPVMYPTVPF